MVKMLKITKNFWIRTEAAGWVASGPDNRFRVLYDIDRDGHAVRILAVGRKEGNRLLVGGEEVEL